MEENEIELMDYLKVIWKRKWIVIIPTFLCVIISIVVSFLLPKKWEIDALIMPSKFFVQTKELQFEEVTAVEPTEIVSQINQASYNHLISAELDLDIRKFPKLKAENLRGTKLVRISLKEGNVEKAKRILYSLFTHLKKELDGKADLETSKIDSKIKSNEMERLKIEKEIRAWKNNLSIIRQSKKEIEKEMKNIREKIESIKEEQRLNLEKEDRSQTERLTLLLYSNEILQNQIYLNTLNEWLSRKKIEEENINSEINNKEDKIKQIENEVESLNERKGRIDFTELIKEPTSSLSPVSPRKKFNVLITGILSFLIFTIFAFFFEYIKKQKIKI